jgi:hypothetical protein
MNKIRANGQWQISERVLPILLGIIGMLLLAACNQSLEGTSLDRLAPCSASGTMFAVYPFEQWPGIYHDTVREVVEAHLTSIEGIDVAGLQCLSEEYRALTPPTGYLRALAQQLSSWQTPSRLQALSEADMGAVLLEFLRVYECSLFERRNFLPIILATGGPDRGAYEKEKAAQEIIIKRELLISRPSLERTLALVGNFDRLRPLAAEAECIKRASLDLKNSLGLAAETSACLSRTWDARGSLRDLLTP